MSTQITISPEIKLVVNTTPITGGSAGQILFQTTGNTVGESVNLFWDATNNRLGVGTSSPAYKIESLIPDVSGGSNVGLFVSDFNLSYSGSSSWLAWARSSALISQSSGIRALYLGNNGFEQGIAFHTASGGIGALTHITLSEVMRLTNARNVLINTTTDAGFKLDVNGTARVNTLTIGLGGGQQATNTALGFQALNANTTAISNVAVGYQALLSTTTGQENVAVGETALRNSNNVANVAVGRRAMLNNTGAQNVVIGHRAVEGTGTGSSNTVIGQQALQALTTGSNNSVVGRNALFAHTTGDSNSVLGADAVSGNFSGSVILGRTATATANNQFVVGSTGTNAGSVTTETNTSTQVWNVIINGVARKILLA